jgi:hypothetical protein
MFRSLLPPGHLLLHHHLLLHGHLLMGGLFHSRVVFAPARIREREVLGARSESASCLKRPVGTWVEKVGKAQRVRPRMGLPRKRMFASVSHCASLPNPTAYWILALSDLRANGLQPLLTIEPHMSRTTGTWRHSSHRCIFGRAKVSGVGLRIWQLLYTTTVALAVSLAVSAVARAAWSDDNIEAAISAPYNGNVAAVSGTCPGASISLYGADGTLRWTAGGGPSDTYDPFCVARVVADSAGNLYVPGVVASTAGSSAPSYVLLSYAQDGTRRWAVPLSVVPDAAGTTQAPAVAVGADGNVYLLAGSTPNDHILGFAAGDGHQILDVPLGVYWDNGTYGLTVALSASTDGLTVTANEEYRLYGYDGALKTDSTVTEAPGLIGQETSIAGSSQSLLLSESSGLINCGHSGLAPVPQQFSVTERGPSGTVWQATSAATTAPCLSGPTLFLRSTPDGGAVITGDPSTGVGGDHLAEFDNQGHVRWDVPISDPSLSNENVYDVRVTTTGEIVLFQGATAPCVGVGGQTSCHEVIITFHNPSDGSQTRPPIVLSDPNSNYANTTPGLQYAPLVLPNRILVDLYGAAPDVVGPQYPVLQSLDVGGLAGDYQTVLETPTPTQGSGPGSASGGGSTGGPPSAGQQFSYPITYLCTPIHASIGKMLLASLECSLLNAISFAECGYGIAQYLVLPLDAAKTAGGLYDLRKIRKEFLPVAKLWNDLLKTRFSKHAPRGFRTGKQVIDKLKKAHHAYQVIEILPNLVKAVSKTDYEKIVNDLVKIAGLEPCVKGIVNGIES